MKINKLLKLNSTLQSLSSKELPLRASYSIAKFLSQTQSDIAFFNTRLASFLSTYSEKDEEGNFKYSEYNNGIVIDPARMDECAKEMQDINNFEVEIPELKIYYEDLEKIDISPEALMELMPYIQT